MNERMSNPGELSPRRTPQASAALVASYQAELAADTDESLVESRATDLMSALNDWLDAESLAYSHAVAAEIERRGLTGHVDALVNARRAMDMPDDGLADEAVGVLLSGSDDAYARAILAETDRRALRAVVDATVRAFHFGSN